MLDIGESKHVFEAPLNVRIDRAYNGSAVRLALRERDGAGLTPQRHGNHHRGHRSLWALDHSQIFSRRRS
jgi:hypothetical protein